MRHAVKALLLSLCSLALACGAPSSPQAPAPSQPVAAEAPAAPAWISELDRAHPLVGKVWDAHARAFVPERRLVERLSGARFVLLGEKHDNPDHHVLQARLLRGMILAGRRPAVVLEMLELAQQPDVDRYLQSSGATAAGFGAALNWQATSWPPFAEYRPVLEAAFSAKLPILAGNIAQETARALVKQGLAALPPERAVELRLDQPFPEGPAAELAEELRASHCGHLPERLIEPMALAQHARDSQMAAVMHAHRESGAVLIAGAGHVRRDRAVPYYLELAKPGAGAELLSVALQEVAHSVTDPSAYERSVDFVWFTPRLSDEDPCAAFRKGP